MNSSPRIGGASATSAANCKESGGASRLMTAGGSRDSVDFAPLEAACSSATNWASSSCATALRNRRVHRRQYGTSGGSGVCVRRGASASNPAADDSVKAANSPAATSWATSIPGTSSPSTTTRRSHPNRPDGVTNNSSNMPHQLPQVFRAATSSNSHDGPTLAGPFDTLYDDTFGKPYPGAPGSARGCLTV